MQIEKTADALFEAVRSYLEKRLKNLPAPRDGKDGVDGMVGLSGRDGAPGPEGKPGPDGAQGLPGTKGMDGAPGEKGMPGDRGEPGEPGEKGEKGEKGDAGERGEKGDPGVAGKDGAPGGRGEPGIHGLPGAEGAPGVKGMDGEPGRDGRDGPPGRDAAQIDILPSINEERSYARGTFASHKGGLWRATRATEGMDGWDCIVEGVAALQLVQGESSKAYSLQVELSSGVQVGKSFFLPAMVYRGVFREGDHYTPGDTVTWAGSTWHCNEQTNEKPIEGGKAWSLSVKRGRDGKDGRNGIDATKPVKLP